MSTRLDSLVNGKIIRKMGLVNLRLLTDKKLALGKMVKPTGILRSNRSLEI
jgi:hypothetical protein